MLKAWKCECNVEVRSICLETLAILFVQQWQYADQPTLLWHDWMLRDFFNFAHQYAKNGWIQPAGITEQIPVGDWQPKCLSAYSHALRACQHERADEGTLATDEWRKIFGDRFKGTQRIASLQTLSAMTLLTGLRV